LAQLELLVKREQQVRKAVKVLKVHNQPHLLQQGLLARREVRERRAHKEV
jgi:hypothetical protein